MSLCDFTKKWESTPSISGTYQRVDSEHILDIFIGKENNSLKHLLLVSENEPIKIKSCKVLEIEKGIREDGQWATKIMLLNKEEDSVFISLCFDLIEHSRAGLTISEALKLFILRFIEWQKLMEKGASLLSRETIRGLIGEIVFMKDFLCKKMSWDMAMSAWLGLDKGDKDFVFYDTWVEVKTITPSKNFVTISSIEQLTSDLVGTLCVIELDNTSSSDIRGFTLNSLIIEMKDLLKSNHNALYEFDNKLLKIGYYEHKDYDDIFYNVNKVSMFRVDENFPKLKKGDIPAGILNARYDVSLELISEFKIIKEL